MKKVLVIILGAALIAAACNKTVSTNSTISSNSGSSTSTSSASSSSQTYTMAQVAQANNASKCWTVINGNVYDLTNWISQHPGGPENILAICGIDGTAAFEGQHAATPKAQRELASFKIGILAN